MAQDIRKMFQEDKALPSKPPKGHQKRFEARLEEALPQEKKEKDSGSMFYFLKIAAVFIVVLGIGFFFLNGQDEFSGEQFTTAPVETETVTEQEEDIPVAGEYQLSDVSPEFKKIEDFYLASLNMELAKLEVNENNKALVDSFMTQLSGLDQEYKKLNAEINETGLTESSVEAMISNLQLRLELLHKLKNKINDIKQSKIKNHENHKA